MTSALLPVKFDKGQGSVVVLLHGLGSSAESWDYTLELCDYTQNRVITLDLLGFGDAPKPRECKYTFDDHANAVIATLDKLGCKLVMIVGHSMGSIVAIEIARKRPDLVNGLVLCGTPLYKKEPRDNWLARMTRSGGLYFKIFRGVRDSPDAMKAGSDVANKLTGLMKGVEITDQTWPAYRGSLEHTIMQFDTYRHAFDIDTPMLFLDGVFDVFIIHKNNHTIVRKNANAKHKTIFGSHELSSRHSKAIARIINVNSLG